MYIDHDLLLLAVGAIIALVSSLITIFVQHFLSLREERIKWEQNREAKELENLKNQLLKGVDDKTISEAIAKMPLIQRYALEKFKYVFNDENFKQEVIEKWTRWKDERMSAQEENGESVETDDKNKA